MSDLVNKISTQLSHHFESNIRISHSLISDLNFANVIQQLLAAPLTSLWICDYCGSENGLMEGRENDKITFPRKQLKCDLFFLSFLLFKYQVATEQFTIHKLSFHL